MPAFFLYGVLGYVTATQYLSITHDYGYPCSSQELADFTAWRPYQYRILFPAIAHVVCPIASLNPYNFFAGVSFVSVMLIPFAFRQLLRPVIRKGWASAPVSREQRVRCKVLGL